MEYVPITIVFKLLADTAVWSYMTIFQKNDKNCYSIPYFKVDFRNGSLIPGIFTGAVL